MYLCSVGQSEHPFTGSLVGNVDCCDQIKRTQTVELTPASGKRDVNRLWWIVTDFKRLRPYEIELHVDMCCDWFVLTGYYQPKHKRYAQRQQFQTPILDKQFTQN